MFKEKLSLTPMMPGCYLMKDKDGNVIYVGKAKKLKNRLKSYFNGTHTGKTLSLVENICDFSYIVTNSEKESLILEINLIKKYNPKYNILLKDDKTYPYIILTNEEYPVLKIERNKLGKHKKQGIFFGPYPNVTSARHTVDLINRIYPLRKCNKLKKDLCLYYHIGECLGFCKNNIDKEKINTLVNEISRILNGDYNFLICNLEEKMNFYSESLQFEKALEYKNLIDDIKKTLNKQIIDSNYNYNFDVFGFCYENGYLSIKTIFIRQGRVFDTFSKIFSNVIDYNDVILRYIINFYDNIKLPKKIIVPDIIDCSLLSEYFNIEVHTPKKGDIKKILDMANNNAEISLKERIETLKINEQKQEKALEELMKIINIEKLDRIEIFDNSHLFGSFYVGGMAVFNKFTPNKKEYRKFKIDLDHPDDLKAMREVLYRRYYRVLLEDLKKTDLIIVDGGEQQVLVAKDVIDSLKLNIKVIGLKKDNKHKTNTIVLESLENILITNSDLLIYLTRMQDEVHRFAINYHNNLRSQGALSSILDNISGIGDKRKKELLKKYKSLDSIKTADILELETIIPKNVAEKLLKYLNKEV